MRQQEIEDEVWRNIRQIRFKAQDAYGQLVEKCLGDDDLGFRITAWFGPNPEELDVERSIYFKTEGNPALELYVVPWVSEKKIDVHVTHIGSSELHEGLEKKPIRPFPESLPERIFHPSDHFINTYRENLPKTAEHYAVYTQVCEDLKPKSILEIGVRAGYSAWSMLRAVPDANYQGIDADDGTNGGEVGYYLYAQEMLRREYPKASVTIGKADSQRMASLMGRYNLIHVDGAHNHDQALHDLELCAPYADYVLIDDTNSISTVRTALTEFLEKYPDCKAWRYDTWHGIVLIDTRSRAGKLAATYYGAVFDQTDLAHARSLILQDNPDDGLKTDRRWTEETDWLMEHIKFPAGGLIFDIGCGVGRLSLPLAKRGHPVIGVDISQPMRAHAEKEVGDSVTFSAITPKMFSALVENGTRGQGAISIWVMQHMLPQDLIEMVRSLYQALLPGSDFFSLNIVSRCVPVDMLGQFGWLEDGFNIDALMEREGFALDELDEMPEYLFPSGAASLKRWVRKR